MTTKLLETIHDPSELRRLSRAQLKLLADEVRECVLHNVSKTGGHLSSNLGTVELTIALHHVFNTPHDRLVWDVGHQTYPHKILTGRRERMPTLRQLGGISGFPRRDESEYDTFGTAHSSTSISAALGMALAARQKGEDRKAVAIIGDGAMTAGMAFEALNNAGVERDARLLVVLNDNDMSISPPVGALNRYLAQLMSGQFYAAAKNVGKTVLGPVPPLFELAKRLEQQDIHMNLTDRAVDAIVDAAFDPAYGARPLKRYIQSHLETLIARKLVAGEIFPSEVVTVDADDEGRLIVADGALTDSSATTETISE